MRPTIRRGSRGQHVRVLQEYLAALIDEDERPYYRIAVDADFGPGTQAAVLRFQEDYESLANDGIVGAHTWGALDDAMSGVEPVDRSLGGGDEAPGLSGESCPSDVWEAWIEQFVPTITNLPVRYGPGRGLNVNGKMVVTYGPGRLAHTNWRGRNGTYPSFHCSSFTNFFLGWVTRRNELFTHRGNIPALSDLVTNSNDIHTIGDEARMTYRGYSPWCQRISPDERYVTALDLWNMRSELPTFLVWGYSTKRGNSWKWWHHTGMFVIDHRAPGSPMYRIAADGYRKDGVYSSAAMQYRSIDEAWCREDVNKHVYRGFGVVGLESVAGRNLPEVAIEQLP